MVRLHVWDRGTKDSFDETRYGLGAGRTKTIRTRYAGGRTKSILKPCNVWKWAWFEVIKKIITGGGKESDN